MANTKKSVNLALQGGGSHGAFTWGVLDYFLESGQISIEAISGTSAGAMNAAVLAQGYMENGIDGARQALENFWLKVSKLGSLSPIQRTPLDVLLGNWSLDGSPAYVAYDLLSRIASPYDTNPLNLNPLRDLVESSIDFDKVRACSPLQLYIAATNVHTGKIRVFTRNELSADMLMASACLPFLYQAVEIDGVPYWDGGYIGNPPLYPLFYNSRSNDVIIVQINPIERRETPRSAREILNRVNEISFNSSLLRELRAVDFVHRLLEEKHLDRGNYNDVLIHRIEATEQLNPLSASSKLNAEWDFLTHLRDIGRNSAAHFLEQHHKDLGEHSSLNLREEFE